MVVSIKIIKEGNTLRLIDCKGELPEGKVLELFTADELQGVEAERSEMYAAQLPSFIRGDEHEAAEELF